jgi:alpha-L-arabinofuranosidase
VIDASAIRAADKLHIFLTNRSIDEVAEVRIAPADLSLEAVESADLLTASDAKAANSYDAPDVVAPRPFNDIAIANGQAVCKLPPLSFVALALT